jgi:hypothetical protein
VYAEEELDDFGWSGPDLEEKATEQTTLFASFDKLKKVEDDTNEAIRQQLQEDTTAHRALATARRMERWAAEEKRRREGETTGLGCQPPRGVTSRLGA